VGIEAGVDPYSVTILSTDDLVVANNHAVKLLTSNIIIRYVVEYVLGEGNTFQDPEESKALLEASVNSGAFTSRLQSTAMSLYPTSGLINATSSSIELSEVTTQIIQDNADSSESSNQMASSGVIIAAVLLPVAAFILLIGVLFMLCYICIHFIICLSDTKYI
jgi:hypothetical protein